MTKIKKCLPRVIVGVLLIGITAVMLNRCAGEETAAKTYRSVSGGEFATQLLAENSEYQLNWDNESKAVIYKNTQTGDYWSDILYDSFLDGNITANGSSPVSITVTNTKTLKWETVSSYSEMQENGNILCKKIDNGIRVTYFFEKYKIAVPVDYTLREDSVLVSVDTSKILEDGEEYKIVSVMLTPCFCSVANDAENGSLFVPVGSGAVMFTAEAPEGTRKYSGEIYGADAARQVPKDLVDDEAIRLPVFGAYGGGKGIMGIIEEGAGSAVIEAQAGNERLGYSNIGATFYMRGYDEFYYTFHGKDKGITQRVNEKISGQKFSLAYYPLLDDDADYNGIAEKYRDYLSEKGNLEKTEVTAGAYSVTFLGGTTVTNSFFGIPTEKTVALTTFSEAQSVLQELEEKNGIFPVVRMSGYGDRGIMPGTVGGGKKYPSIYGTDKELKDLLEYEKKSLLFMDSEIVQFSKSSAGFFKSFDTAQTAINYKAEHFPVSPIRVMDESNPYYIISRQKLFKAAELVLSKAEKYGNQGICFSSLGSVAFSDYSDEKYINRNHMEEDVSSILSDVKKDGKTAAVAAANDYAACAADILFDTPDSNGSYTVFDMEIPFYQMVFHSYKPMYTQAVNLSENSELMVAKAAAFGMGLGYTLSYRYEDRSDELDLYKLYGTVYKDNTDNIYDALVKKQFAEIYEKTCDARIVRYELLSNGVSKTEFSNGLTLYANQQNVGADSPAGALAPYEFRITG